MPQISVAILTYDRTDYLREAIESVLADKDLDLELIVLDTASPVDVKAIIDGFSDSRLKYHYHPVNLGMVGALNKCIDLCTGEFVLILNDDDRVLPTGLRRLSQALIDEPEAGVSIASVWLINEKSEQIGEKQEVTTEDVCITGADFYKAYLTGKIPVQPSTIFVRKSILDQAGYYDGSFEYGPDMDLLLRVGLKSKKVCLLADALGEYRIHGGSITEHLRRNAEIGVSFRDIVKKQYELAKAAAIFSADELENVFKQAHSQYTGSCIALGLNCFRFGEEEVARQYFAVAKQMAPDLISKLYISALVCVSFAGKSTYNCLRQIKRLLTRSTLASTETKN
jgi:glycosyltransferase involved in cell wall biosynthesis